MALLLITQFLYLQASLIMVALGGYQRLLQSNTYSRILQLEQSFMII